MPYFSNRSWTLQSGFNLIEVSMALVLIGIMFGAGLSVYQQHRNERAERITNENMKTIIKALSDYAAIANRIPCPANPAATGINFGWESSTTAPTLASPPMIGNCKDGDPGVRHGIIPYHILNIPYETIKDGWGHYITYMVSPVYTQDMDASLNDTEEVLPKCREVGWVATGPRVANGPKARLCCAWTQSGVAGVDQPSDLTMHRADTGYPVISEARPAYANPPYQPQNNLLETAGRPVPAAYQTEPPAFALVSHGINGLCAYKGNDTNDQLDCNLASLHEQKNGAFPTDNKNPVTGPRTNDFDDVVYYLTISGLMAAGGAASCAYP